jgi:hypothetical protein
MLLRITDTLHMRKMVSHQEAVTVLFAQALSVIVLKYLQQKIVGKE